MPKVSATLRLMRLQLAGRTSTVLLPALDGIGVHGETDLQQ